MPKSMTGFASGNGAAEGWSWTWDVRSVNARGLDIRLRVPDWIEGLEQALRAAIQKAVARGSVSLTLRVHAEAERAAGSLNRAGLEKAVRELTEADAVARAAGLSLGPVSPAELLALPGVIDAGPREGESAALAARLSDEIGALLDELDTMRQAEGKALGAVLSGQIDTIEQLVGQASGVVEARAAAMAENLRANLTRVMDNADGADPDRVAQELALLAVKSDVTEELDRLRAHVTAARDLLARPGPIGRKLDFLTQEFNREANTLCSKSQFSDLTRIGLDLKAAIDQMREQVQNVE